MASVDHYRLLGVPRDAPRPVIRAAYVRKMKLHHPDRAGGARPQAALAVALGEAYACLRNDAERAAYDAHLARFSPRSDADASRRRRQWRRAWRTGMVRHAPFGRNGFLVVAVAAAVATGIVAHNQAPRPRFASPPPVPIMPAAPAEAPLRSPVDEGAALRELDEARRIFGLSRCPPDAIGDPRCTAPRPTT